MQTISHCDLLPYNTFGISQHCDKLIRYHDELDAIRVAEELDGYDPSVPYMVIGGGSNLLPTRDFHGTIVTPEPYFDVKKHDTSEDDKVDICCWAGTTFDDVVDWTIEHGLHGLENLSLVPGQCGAAAVQNIGAYGVEIKDLVARVDAVRIKDSNDDVSIFMPDSLEYAYRYSRFKADWHNCYLITHVWLRLSRSFKPKLDYGNIRQALRDKGIVPEEVTPRQLRDTIIEIRQAKLPDPKVLGNAGSFFMNPVVDERTFNRLKAEHPDLSYFEMPPETDSNTMLYDDHGKEMSQATRYKIPAGWLIEQCGWKGKRMGPAGVYEKQALVLVNHGGAKGQDIVNLMHAIQDDVRQKFGLELKPEVNVL